MKIDFEGARLYVRPGSTDLRKGVTGLLAIIENEKSDYVRTICGYNFSKGVGLIPGGVPR